MKRLSDVAVGERARPFLVRAFGVRVARDRWVAGAHETGTEKARVVSAARHLRLEADGSCRLVERDPDAGSGDVFPDARIAVDAVSGSALAGLERRERHERDS